MKIVKVLGTGCSSCKRTEEILNAVIEQLNLDLKVEKVEDIQEIMKYNVMSTPAIVVDDIVVLKGGVPSLSDAKEILENASVASSCSGDGSCCGGGNHEHGESCNSESHTKEGSCCSH
ncbi:thioredoxin family protein [Lutibacter sp.]|uniref:thioredoxin family protein n=1 Tax=Lutibacter sp. TaxID=1925666 RepID=UPI0025C2A27E|nr:thioredoxin family protein [Lutibacter sp.]MCF6181232.1 thioredoxin family protein [Lutibacter sp.]